MLCALCQTKFCWNCNAILNKLANPYDHFANNPVCHLFGHVAIASDLTESELDSFNDEEKFLEMLKSSQSEQFNPLDLFLCPGCCCNYVRDRSKINVINCIVCRKKYCFMCRKALSGLDEPIEKAKEHFEVSFCRYQELGKPPTKEIK